MTQLCRFEAGSPAPINSPAQAPVASAQRPVRRMADGKPDLNGFFQADAGGANYGLEKRPAVELTPPGRGVIIDPPDGKLPIQPWAKSREASRDRPERGYDDPTAHCFVAGVPRSCTRRRPSTSCRRPTQSSSCTSAWRGASFAQPRRTCPTPCGCGRATRSDTGKARPWSSRPGTSTAGPGSTKSERSSATPSGRRALHAGRRQHDPVPGDGDRPAVSTRAHGQSPFHSTGSLKSCSRPRATKTTRTAESQGSQGRDAFRAEAAKPRGGEDST